VSERVSEFRSGDRPRHIYRAASFFLFLMSEEEESMKLEKRKDENKFNFFPLRGMQRHKRISLPVSLRKKERKPNSSFSLLRSGCSTELEWIGEDLPTYTASGPEAWTRSVGSLSLSLSLTPSTMTLDGCMYALQGCVSWPGLSVTRRHISESGLALREE